MKNLLWGGMLSCFVVGCAPRHAISPEVVSLRERPSDSFPIIRKELIIIDAGHGGKDPGTSNKRHSYVEKDLTLMTARYLCASLRQRGYQTLLTRKEDVFVPLTTRAEIANFAEADLFISVHYNHSPNEEANGIEVYYYREGKVPHSERILISRALGYEVLRHVVRETRASARGIKEANFAVLRETKMPAILVEGGFLSHAGERKKICDPQYLKKLASGIAEGVEQFLEKRPRRESNARPAA